MRRLGNVVVDLIRRTRQKASDGSWSRDARGNAVYVEQSVSTSGCSFQPGDSTEDRGDGGRDQVVVTGVLYAPLSFRASAKDAVRVGGVLFEVVGDPVRWEHPRLGHVIAQLRAVRG